MSTHADTNDGTDFELPATAADDEASRADLLDALLAHLDGLAGVDATEVDAHCCGALGCTRTESRLWRVDVDGVLAADPCIASRQYQRRGSRGWSS